MKITKWKSLILDVAFLTAATLLPLPLLIMGIPPLVLLIWSAIMVASYSALRKKEKKQLVVTAILWPIFTVLVGFAATSLLMIPSFQVLTLWFTLPGVITYILLLFAFVGGQLLGQKFLLEEKELTV